MSDGLLDEVEKAIDDFSVDEKKEINSNVKKIKRGIDDHWDSYYRSREQARYQQLHEEVRARRHTLYGERPSIPIGTGYELTNITCKCNSDIVVVTKEYDNRYDEYSIMRRPPEMSVHQFVCPCCSYIWRIMGKPVEIKIKMGN